MGISPLELFHDYGIRSYNLAMHGNSIKSNYYCMKATFERLKKGKRQLPKVVVMDIFPFQEEIFRLHSMWDSFPISTNKIEMADVLAPEVERKRLLFPFAIYHSRWNELGQEDFRPKLNSVYGMSTGGYGVFKPDGEIIIDSSGSMTIDDDTADYLCRMKTECETLGIQLIFIQIPYPYQAELQRKANGICQYVQANGNYCENYMGKDIGIDYDIDYFDSSHLNIAGMRIMTKEVGKLLSGLGLEDYRTQPVAEYWKKAYEDFVQFKITKLMEMKDAKTCLMSLSDPEFISIIQVKNSLLDDIQYAKLIERLKAEGNQVILVDTPIEIVSEEDGQKKRYDIYCKIYRRNEPQAIVCLAGF